MKSVAKKFNMHKMQNYDLYEYPKNSFLEITSPVRETMNFEDDEIR